MTLVSLLIVQAAGMAIAAVLIWTGDYRPTDAHQQKVAAILVVLWPIPVAAFLLGIVGAIEEEIERRKRK